MKKTCIFLLVVSLFTPASLFAAFYQWTDAAGVLHMTDNPDNIPREFKGKATRVEMEEPAARPVPPPAAVAPPQASQELSQPGGHGENWWRDRFAMLRSELETLRTSRRQMEEELVQLRRKRTIFQGARDREAVNAKRAEVAEVDKRISEVMNKIDALELAAARAGVPAEWRR